MKRSRTWLLLLTFLLIGYSYSPGRSDFPESLDMAIFTDSGQSLDNRNTQGVAAAFLDQNQSLDVFAANTDGNRVWLNDGTGQFSHNGQLLGSADSEDVALANLDSDNDVDAIVANLTSPNQVWLNDGSGQFTAGQTITSTMTRAVASGDINGDNEPDLYFANQGADTLWWGIRSSYRILSVSCRIRAGSGSAGNRPRRRAAPIPEDDRQCARDLAAHSCRLQP
jgi:hypothetical protein